MKADVPLNKVCNQTKQIDTFLGKIQSEDNDDTDDDE